MFPLTQDKLADGGWEVLEDRPEWTSLYVYRNTLTGGEGAAMAGKGKGKGKKRAHRGELVHSTIENRANHEMNVCLIYVCI